MKKFLLPLQNMVRADLFSGSLAVWNALGFLIHFAPPAHSEPRKARRGANSVRAISRIHRQQHFLSRGRLNRGGFMTEILLSY